jgi:DNA polymerase III gamma/tau subunit
MAESEVKAENEEIQRLKEQIKRLQDNGLAMQKQLQEIAQQNANLAALLKRVFSNMRQMDIDFDNGLIPNKLAPAMTREELAQFQRQVESGNNEAKQEAQEPPKP